MFCPSCGKQIPDQSIFCMFCGTRIDIPQLSVSTFNARPPVNVSEVFFGFVGPVTLSKKGGSWSWGEVSRDGFWVGLSLVDDKKNPTAYGGTIILNIEITQGRTEPKYESLLKTKVTLNVKASDFRRDEKTGLPYYRYEHSAKIQHLKIPEHSAYGNIELYFTPQGSKQQLYKEVSIRADAQAA